MQDYKNYGLFCRGAIKGPGSVDYSHKWLQSLLRIVIDPVRCPDTWKEFSEYEYERGADGETRQAIPMPTTTTLMRCGTDWNLSGRNEVSDVTKIFNMDSRCFHKNAAYQRCKRSLKVDVAISTEMQAAIDQWR